MKVALLYWSSGLEEHRHSCSASLVDFQVKLDLKIEICHEEFQAHFLGVGFPVHLSTKAAVVSLAMLVVAPSALVVVARCSVGHATFVEGR